METDYPIRKIRPSSRSVTGFYVSRRGEKLEFESQLERDCYLLLDFEFWIRKISVQSMRIANHIPDSAVDSISGETVVIEVKFETELLEKWEELSEKFSRINEYCVQNGLQYCFMTDFSRRDQNSRITLLKLVSQVARSEAQDADLDSHLLKSLSDVEHSTIKELADRWNVKLDYGSKLSRICRMVVEGAINLLETPGGVLDNCVVSRAIPIGNAKTVELPAFLIPYSRLVERMETHPLRSLQKGVSSIDDGHRLEIGGELFDVINSEKLGDVEVRSVKSGERYYFDMSNVPRAEKSSDGLPHDVTAKGAPTIAIQRDYPQRYGTARDRHSAIASLIPQLDKGLAIKDADLERISREANTSIRTLRRWIRRYKESGFSGLLTSNRIGGEGKLRMRSDVEGIIRRLIDEEYLTNQRKKPAEIYRLVQAECYRKGLPPPSQMTVYGRIHDRDPRTTLEKRFGVRRALEKYGLTGGEFQDKLFPLQSIQIDHSRLDLRVRDNLTGEVVARPWLTVALDIFSRCVWGFYLGLQQPNDDAVGLTILMGSQKKDYYTDRFQLSEWPVFGIPWQIHVDNGMDFRSKLLDAGCFANEINVMRRPVKTPRYGAYIERFFRTLEEKFVHNLPGTTFSNPKERADYDSDKEALLTVDELEKSILRFIVNEYHNGLHTELGMTPLERWKSGLKESSITPREPQDIERFRLDFLSFVDPDGTRTIQKGGVHFKDLIYFHPELNLLPLYEADGKTPRKYYAKYDPSDLRYLYILDDREGRNAYRTLPLKNCPAKAITLREVEATREQLRKRGNHAPSESIVLESILRRRDDLQQLAFVDINARKKLAASRRTHEVYSRIERNSKPLSGPERSEQDDEIADDYMPSLRMEEISKNIRLSSDLGDE